MEPEKEIYRVIACDDGYDNDALGNALSYARAIRMKNAQADAEVILLTHTKTQLNTTSLSTQLGGQLAKGKK